MQPERLARVAMLGSAASVLTSGVSFLAPEEAVLEAMLAGWVAQQRSRLLAATTIEQRVLLVRRLVAFSNDYPWRWTPSDVEEWTTALVGRGLAHSTLRNYQMAVQLFCDYLTISATAGTRSASSGSGLIRCRSSTSGTPARTARRLKGAPATGR